MCHIGVSIFFVSPQEIATNLLCAWTSFNIKFGPARPIRIEIFHRVFPTSQNPILHRFVSKEGKTRSAPATYVQHVFFLNQQPPVRFGLGPWVRLVLVVFLASLLIRLPTTYSNLLVMLGRHLAESLHLHCIRGIENTSRHSFNSDWV
jgi:hypothetical protein